MYARYRKKYEEVAKKNVGEFEMVKEKYKKSIKDFESTINLLYYKRPSSWLELDYEFRC
jgi:hypothetical protein